MTVAMLSDQETFKQGFLWEKKDNSSLLAFKQKHSIEKAVAAAGDEFSRMIALNEWTYNQFKIFGRPTVTTENALEILQKVSEGHTFYCAHYAIVYVVAAPLPWAGPPGWSVSGGSIVTSGAATIMWWKYGPLNSINGSCSIPP